MRGTGARSGPAKVAYPLKLGVTGDSVWAPAAVDPAPPRPAPPPVRVSAIVFYSRKQVVMIDGFYL